MNNKFQKKTTKTQRRRNMQMTLCLCGYQTLKFTSDLRCAFINLIKRFLNQ